MKRQDWMDLEDIPVRVDKWVKENSSLELDKHQIRDAIQQDKLALFRGGVCIPVTSNKVFVFPGDTVLYDNAPLNPQARQTRTFALFKPKNLLTTTKFIKICPSNIQQMKRRYCMATWIKEIVSNCSNNNMPSQKFFPIGRLDKKTSGLLLVTNDGDLAYRLCTPGVITKHYIATIQKVPSQQQLSDLLQGVQLSDGFAKVLSCHVVANDKAINETCSSTILSQSNGDIVRNSQVECNTAKNTDNSSKYQQFQRPKIRLCVSVNIGRNKIVRRILAHVGLPVQELERIQIGTIHLAQTLNLRLPGDHCELTQEQIDSLWASSGGRQIVSEKKIQALTKLGVQLNPKGIS